MTADHAAIRARLEAATQGPWTATTHEATMNDRSEYRFGATDRPQVFRAVVRYADAALIANAPADLRALLYENERLAAKVEYVEYLIRHDDAAMDLWWTVTDDDWAVPDCMPGRFLRAALDGSET